MLHAHQVNGQKLLGLNHVEVVVILKELPRDVRIVCARRQPVLEEGPVEVADAEDKLFKVKCDIEAILNEISYLRLQISA